MWDKILLGFLIFLGKTLGQTTSPPENCPDLYDINNLDALTQEHFVSLLTDHCRYDKLIKPNTDQPLPIYLQISLNHMESTNNVEFTAYMVVQYQYNDNRLKFDKLSPSRHTVLGEETLENRIWIPKLILKNDKDTSVRGIEGKDVFVSISPEGGVVYSYRMTATFYCWMDLTKFPFDSQQCSLIWSTWTYNTSNLELHWNVEDAVLMATNLHLTEFVLDETLAEENIVDGTFSTGHLVGQFTELRFVFKLNRQIGYYMMDYFLPSILLVCTSWVTFWLQADAGPPRATLGTSTVVAFITLNLGLTKDLPKVSYVKAVDIWFLGISCFIFGSLAEFAFVNVIWRRRKQVEVKKEKPKYLLKSAITPSLARKEARDAEAMFSEVYKINEKLPEPYLTLHGLSPISLGSSQEEIIRSDGSTTTIAITESTPDPTFYTMSPQDLAIWVDRKARIVFPVAFLIFNLFYWTFVYVL